LATGGTLAYDGSDLLLNGVPISGSGGSGVVSVTGGSNITVTDNSANPIVNLDIKEDIDMCGNDLNNVNFVNVNSVINVGSLTTNNPTINLVTTNTGGTSINTYDGAISSTVEYTTFDTTMRMKSEANVELRAKNNAHAINLGPTTQSITIITYDDSSVVSRVNNGLIGHGVTTLSSDGTFQIGSTDISNDPSVRFQGVSAESVASIKMKSATGTLTVESTSATATMQIAVPLHDVSSGTAGAAGQVLTSAGTGSPPYWAAVGESVTSVTAGPTGNITVAPVTGDVVVDLCRNIVLSGSQTYVAVGDNAGGTTIRYSYDGLTWSNTINAFTTYGNGVAYNNGVWVAVGQDSGGNTIKHSTDGITWENAISGAFDSTGRGIAYGNGQWVAVGDGSGNTIKYSSDALNWTNSTNGFRVYGQSIGGYGIAYGGGSNWVAVGHDIASLPNPGKNIKYSSDNGVSWSNATSNTFTEIQTSYGYGVYYGNSRFIAVGFDPNSTNATIKYSTDNGATWVDSLSGSFDYAGRGVAFDGVSTWITVGQDASGNTIRISTDNGVNWTNVMSGGFGDHGRGVAYANSMWFAVGDMNDSTSTIKYSSDGGLTWSDAVSGAFSVSGRGIAIGAFISPSLQFKSGSDTVGLSLSEPGQLVVSGSVGASTQIAVPLRDVASGTAGVAGQVLTSAGTGSPPYWASASGGSSLALLGRYWTKTSDTITIDSALFPGLPTSGTVKMRIEMMGAGGGGGGGITVPSGAGANSGGGGGQGFVQSAIIIYPISEDLIITIGSGGAGGTGGTIFGGGSNGGNGGSTYLKKSISNKILATALGGYGGQTDGIGGGGLSNGVGSDNNPNGSPGGEGGGYYGGASGSNAGISGDTSSGTGCGGGGGYGGGGGGSGGNGGAGDCGSCLIEIIDILP
jgi:hypothetical protein